MTQQEFEDTLRQFLRQEPFRPFVVELNSGETIYVPSSELVTGGGAATLLINGRLDELLSEEVCSIHAFEEYLHVGANGVAAMTEQEFEETMRQFLNRKPFRQFLVELNGGRVIAVPHQNVILAYGEACFVAPGDQLVEILFKEVRDIRPMERKAVS